MGLYVRRLDVRSQRSLGSVDQNLAQIIEQFLGPVLRLREIEQLRILVDEVGVHGSIQKLLILEDVQQKRNVGLDPPHPEFPQGAVHFGARGLQVLGVGDHLHQKRVVVGRDDGPRERRRPVQSDPHALSRAEHLDPAGVRLEVLGGVLRGDPALNREPLDLR
jgi:hypothetical protein